ncbi:BREX-1 system adenine-specific DNA-methyltransferase PglX [Methanospirillum sp. J.3.6.1-F.2.7.3]|uniref:BREX-1 system adenine-specific DNA-methyltransferase PglX n=2 Tax=Methanospirillum purgamenti TaxID=2834276 RepID=A0A8E7AYP5_9EURY|nr:BREX-1 system adenine-specific DNA-methyltransferase PglX [Methanospirillum sp. J.3.6.1-F.2.7.3]
MCVRGREMSDTKSNNPVPNFYRASAEDFKKIPGSPIAYWVSNRILSLFDNPLIGDNFVGKEGVGTRNDNLFLRFFWEVSYIKIGREKRWILTDKAGDYRRWYMGCFYVMDWENDGHRIKNYRDEEGILKSRPQNIQYLFKEGITWGKVGSGKTSFRWRPVGFGFNDAAPTLFGKDIFSILPQLNSKLLAYLVAIKGETLNVTTGAITELPLLQNLVENYKLDFNKMASSIINISKTDWDSYETSWDFTTLPLVSPEYLTPTIEASYQKLRTHWQEMTKEMLSLEEENNKIFIEAYGLQDELTPDVPLSEITLTCNPHYRYDANKPEEELEGLLRTDTIKELISYAVGCMVGRYSLDTPGLILANQGETVDDYLSQIPQPSFKPDDDNIIPVLDDEYFTDDIVFRFKDFLKVVFGEKTLSQNLDYIAQALTGKSTSSPEKVIRDYFSRDFFKDHVQRYKKRPIYWMFSSGKQQGFNALVYMHRYNKTTLAKMRTDYLLELEAKLDAELTALNEDPVKNKARISKIKKQVDEMKTWDELLNNKALALIEIDLDDGVVVNYAKFEGLVRAI